MSSQLAWKEHTYVHEKERGGGVEDATHLGRAIRAFEAGSL